MSDIVILENNSLQVAISDRVGASVYSLKYRLNGEWVEVMRPTPEEALAKHEPGRFSSFPMIPYSNRLAEGVLSYGGKQYSLEPNNADGHRIHGDVRNKPWKVVTQESDVLIVEFDSMDFPGIGWPFPFKARMEFGVSGNSFTTTMLVKNVGEEEMPAGMGIHPYFMRRLTDLDHKVFVAIPVQGAYPGETPIPTGTWLKAPSEINFSHGKELTEAFLDKCYRADDPTYVITWPGSGVKLTMAADPVYKHVIIYCPLDDHEFFAVEPVTNCNNGFNMADQGVEDTGTVYLQPGEQIEGDICISMEQV